VEDQQLAELLGQDVLTARVLENLEAPDNRLVRLTGAAGSGKSSIARRVATDWRDNGGTCVLAVGDDEHSWRELYPLLSGLSRAHRDWAGLASTGTRSAIRLTDSATGGAGTSIFDLLTAAFRQQTERALKPYSSQERDVILDLKRLARSHRLLLVADNAHWWDADSLRLLGDVLSEPLGATISQLRSVSVLLVDTAADQSVAAPNAFDALVARCAQQTLRTSPCTREQFPAVLKAFGVRAELPESVIGELFSATHGHLKLAEQVAAYEKHTNVSAPVAHIDAEFLSTLFSQRFASLGSVTPEVTDLVVRAAVLGLSCTEQDLQCIAERHRPDVRVLIERAESIGFVERTAEQITFSHDVIRSAILSAQTPSRLEGLYLKLAECLATLRPGDYEARAQALLQGGDKQRARAMVALAGVAQIRRGVAAAKVLRRVALQCPDDRELTAYLEVIAEGYSAVGSGKFAATLPTLRTPLATETTAMAAERNYVASICSLGRQTLAGAEEARDTLGSWSRAVEAEVELGLRFLILLQQAQVLSEMFDEARATEMVIEQKLSARAHYDIDAAVMIQVQNRRAGAVIAPEVAEERIRRAVSFFTRGTGDPGRDQLELFRSLTNLAAIEIRLDKNTDAFAHALEAERIAVESLDVGHRLDVLASNIVLAGFRSDTIDLDATIARQSLVAHGPDVPSDNFIHRCNLAAYLLLASRDMDAAAELEGLGEEVLSDEIDETYLVYYWSALSVASAAVRGDTEEAMRIHQGMQGFVDSLQWPCVAYIRRRQRLLEEFLPTLRGDEPRMAADRLLLDARPMQVGRAWPYYGRLIPCAELSFWSDS
jgi:hypothetical protein